MFFRLNTAVEIQLQQTVNRRLWTFFGRVWSIDRPFLSIFVQRTLDVLRQK